MAEATSSAAEITRLAPAFHALADENRLRILEALTHGERCVCELINELEMSQSLLSFHLGVLRRAGFVSARRQGKWIHYHADPGAVSSLARHLTTIEIDTTPRPTPPEC